MNPRQCELIGKFIEVKAAKNKQLIGIKGKVVDETKNLVVLSSGKKVLKDCATIEVVT